MFTTGSSNRSRRCLAVVAATAVLSLASQAGAQIHGVQIGKSCTSPRCVGETTDCVILVGHGDGWGDTIRIVEAFDVIEPTGINVRVPAMGDLPIVAIEGNAMCADSGGACDQSAGVNCALPCVVGPANSTLSGLPGDPQQGIVRFRQNTYVIQPGDASPLRDQANVSVQDLCDSPTTQGCSNLPNLVQFTASTVITRCADLECQVEACANGVCSSTSICVDDPDFCDDDNECTTDVCNDDAGGCCEYTPVPCDDSNACTTDSCDADTGCVFDPITCNDDNACTTDSCDTVKGCIFTPVVCDDENACTTDTCDIATGCVYTENPPCDDNNACTTDICDPDLGCVYTPNAPCDDDNACTTDTCDSVKGCVFTENPPCDDNDACTTDRCDPATGCVYTQNPPCNDSSACTTDRCDPVLGCVYTENPPCDDDNECTRDACVPTAPGDGCVYTPIPVSECGDENECTEDSCDPAVGCINTPECETADDCEDDGTLCTREICTSEGCCDREPVVCQDKDPCTDAVCDPKTGLCSFPPTDPPPAECVDFDGCTPGFWKQPHHLQYWPVGYLPGDRVDDVFGVDSTDNPTLLEALSSGGGGEIAFLRHAVAALLNSAHGDVDYKYATAQVIAMVQAAYASGDFATPHGLFAEENERGCTVVKLPRGSNDRIGGGKKK